MKINKQINGKELILTLEGRLDTTTAPNLEQELNKEIENVESLIFDFSNLEYLSSAGLRILLTSQKIMNTKGEMIIRNVNDTIMEIFEITGFSDILSIKNNG